MDLGGCVNICNTLEKGPYCLTLTSVAKCESLLIYDRARPVQLPFFVLPGVLSVIDDPGGGVSPMPFYQQIRRSSVSPSRPERDETSVKKRSASARMRWYILIEVMSC